MKVLIAPDKFKGSLSAQKVAAAITKGICQKYPNAKIVQRPMADGGDGSLAVLEHYLHLHTHTLIVADPLMRPISASYKMSCTRAYIEMAAASGLALLSPTERNARLTSSFGTGELIKDALQKGAKSIYLFIGGSATNDGGIGIAHALGYRFFDKKGKELQPIGENLVHIEKIDSSPLFFDFSKINIQVICDVINPFFGKNGAAYIYAPQKGASPEDVEYLDKGLKNLARKLEEHAYPSIGNKVGAGAAGGVGGGAIAFLNAQLVSGISVFLDLTELEKEVQKCDYIITGEGKLDAQTEQGKVISGISTLAQKYNKPLIAVCGAADKDAAHALGIHSVFTVLERATSLEDALVNAEKIITEIGIDIFPHPTF